MIFNGLIILYHKRFSIKKSIYCVVCFECILRNILLVHFNGWVKFDFNEILLNSETISSAGHLSAYIALNILLCYNFLLVINVYILKICKKQIIFVIL